MAEITINLDEDTLDKIAEKAAKKLNEGQSFSTWGKYNTFELRKDALDQISMSMLIYKSFKGLRDNDYDPLHSAETALNAIDHILIELSENLKKGV